MGYLLAEILACLLLAGLVGIFIGWLLRGGCDDKIKLHDEAWEAKLKDYEVEHETKIRSLINKYDSKIKSEHDFYNSKIKNMESSYNLKYKTELNEKEALKTQLLSAKTELSNIKDTLDLKLKDTDLKWENQLQSHTKDHEAKILDAKDEIQRLKTQLQESKNELERSNKTWAQMLKDTDAKWEKKVKNPNTSSKIVEELQEKLKETEKELQDAKKELATIGEKTQEKEKNQRQGIIDSDTIKNLHQNIELTDIEDKSQEDTKDHNTSDLLNLPDINEQYSKLLQAIGINSKEKLNNTDAGRIFFEMTKYNQKHSVVAEIPSVSQIQSWQNRSNHEEYRQISKKDLQECYNVEDIVGVGVAYGRKLRNRGVKNSCVLASKYLTNNTATHKVAKKLNIDFDAIRSWASMADLMRVPGIGSQYAYILHMVGVSSREDLKYSDATNLYNELVKFDGYSNVKTEVPALSMIQEWINFLHK